MWARRSRWLALFLAATAHAQDAPEPASAWSGSTHLGATLAVGDTDVFSGNFEGEADWTGERSSTHLGIRGLYGLSDGEVDANSQSATVAVRRNFGERVFSQVDIEVGRDTIQAINWRLLASAGPGFRVWADAEKHHLDLQAGVGYRHEAYRGATNTRDDVNFRAAFDHENGVGALEISHTGEFLLPGNDPNGFLARSDIVLSVPLTGAWHFRNSLSFEYQNDPAQGGEATNLKASIGLEYRF